MELSIPTLVRLVDEARADIKAVRSSGAAFLRKTVEYAIATVAGGLVYGLYSRLPQIAKDIVPGPQNSESALLHHASLWLATDEDRLPASPARLTITGTGTEGTELDEGTRFRRSDGALYETTELLVFGTDDIVVQSIALEGEAGYGDDGNTLVGDELTLVDNIVGLDAAWIVEGEVDDTVGGGSDLESLPSLADRVLERGANPPRGGKLADYEAWARASSSAVGNAFASAGLGGPGTIWISIVTDDPLDPFPDGALLDVVEEHVLEEAHVQVGTILIFAPVALELDPDIELSPNTSATRAAAIAAMEEIIAMRATPGQYGNDGLFRRSWLTEALSGTFGEIDHTLVSPAEDVEVGVLELVRLGTPTFSTKA